MARYFTPQEGYVYLPVLQDIVDSYNRTFHRTIGMAPTDVNDNNTEEVRLSTYFARKAADKKYTVPRHRRYRFKIGNYVVRRAPIVYLIIFVLGFNCYLY